MNKPFIPKSKVVDETAKPEVVVVNDELLNAHRAVFMDLRTAHEKFYQGSVANGDGNLQAIQRTTDKYMILTHRLLTVMRDGEEDDD